MEAIRQLSPALEEQVLHFALTNKALASEIRHGLETGSFIAQTVIAGFLCAALFAPELKQASLQAAALVPLAYCSIPALFLAYKSKEQGGKEKILQVLTAISGLAAGLAVYMI